MANRILQSMAALGLLFCMSISRAENPSPTITTPPASSTETDSSSKKINFKGLYAMMKTSMGDIKARLYFRYAPKLVFTFVELAEGKKAWKNPETSRWVNQKFYQNLLFHKVVRDHWIQTGDPSGTGRGGPGFKFEKEFHPSLDFSRGGMLAMANASQFFITCKPSPDLNGQFPIIGEVVEGLEVVEKISRVPKNPLDKPLTPVRLETLTIERIF